MATSCTSAWSVEVMYTHPPHARVRATPTASSAAARRARCCRPAAKAHRPTSTNRGPDVAAIAIWNTLRSGNQSPMVALTDGQNSSGHPATWFLTTRR